MQQLGVESRNDRHRAGELPRQFFRPHRVWLGATALLVSVLLLVSCGSSKSTQGSSSSAPNTATVASSTDSSPTTTSKAPVQPPSFQGPIFLTCASDSDPEATATVSKLNLATGALVKIAEYPNDPTSLCLAGHGLESFDGSQHFGAQLVRTLFTRDFQKAAMPHIPDKTDDVGYYDASLKQYVDVTKIVSPANGDFDVTPVHRGGYFTEDDLFGFFDWRSKKWNFFDTHSRKVVRESDQAVYPWFAQAVQIGDGRTDDPQDSWPPGARTCDGVWVVNNSMYIREDPYTPGGTQYSLGTIPSEAESSVCTPADARPITPSSKGMEGIASDRSGSTIIFLVISKDNSMKLYKANTQNPEQPSMISVNPPFGPWGTGTENIIISWE